MHWDAPIKEYSDFLTGCDNIEFVGSGNTLRESNLLWMRNIGGVSWCSRGHRSRRGILARVDRGARDRSHEYMRSGGLRNLLGDFFVSFHFSFDISGLRTIRVGLSTGRFNDCLSLHNSLCSNSIMA